MHLFIGILGLALILSILFDSFETIILPRRVTRRFRLTRAFYRNTWIPWSTLAKRISNRKRREALLSFYGPLSLIVLLLLWAIGMIVGFAMLQWAAGSWIVGPEPENRTFWLDLYFSGTTFTTLGIGDERPITAMGRFLMVIEAGTGFGFLAIIIGYLPVVYQAFSRRESNISLLDARAGSPPSAVELIRRYAEHKAMRDIDSFLHQWEQWSAELLESHVSYPALALFRSQHDNESWLGALTSILDATALLIVGIRDAPARQAQLTFAMARHAVVDLAQVLKTPPTPPVLDRLPPEDMALLYQMLRASGVQLTDGDEATQKLAELRAMYEPYVNALSQYLVVALPSWLPKPGIPDNWQTSAWGRASTGFTARAADRTMDEHY